MAVAAAAYRKDVTSSPTGNNISRRSFIEETWVKIADGSFGDVWKVVLDCGLEDENPTVAVKKLNTTDYDEYIDEREKIASFHHPNLIKLIGIAPGKKEIPWFVMEYPSRGSLLTVLLNYPGQMPGALMVKLARDIACGMECLHEHDDIHGDLSARNCLISEDWTAKIADFGIHNCYEIEQNISDYVDYEDDEEDAPIKLPLRWMPPENVPLRKSLPKFTAMGDVWAYGVLLYEIWCNGLLPYHGLDDEMVLNSLDIAKDTGKFAFSPRYYHAITARAHIIYLMDQCWKIDPHRRPLFSDIVDHFAEHEPDIMATYKYKLP